MSSFFSDGSHLNVTSAGGSGNQTNFGIDPNKWYILKDAAALAHEKYHNFRRTVRRRKNYRNVANGTKNTYYLIQGSEIIAIIRLQMRGGQR